MLLMLSVASYQLGSSADPYAIATLCTSVPAGGRPPVTVASGAELQAALDRATGGDTILLDPRATFRPVAPEGAFVLRRRKDPDKAWVTIRSADSVFDAEGALRPTTRVSASNAQSMPKIRATSSGAFKTEAGAMTRLSVNLTKQATYRIRAEGTSLKVTLVPGPTTSVASAEGSGGDAADNELTDVKFERKKAPCASGCDRVVVSTSNAPSGRIRLELKKTQLSKSLAKTLDLTPSHGSLKSVTTFFDDKANATVVEIDREGLAQGAISVDGKNIVWSFDVPAAAIRPRTVQET